MLESAILSFAYSLVHRHRPVSLGRRITAITRKDNLPAGEACGYSTGDLARCECGKKFILHDPVFGFRRAFTEIVGVA